MNTKIKAKQSMQEKVIRKAMEANVEILHQLFPEKECLSECFHYDADTMERRIQATLSIMPILTGLLEDQYPMIDFPNFLAAYSAVPCQDWLDIMDNYGICLFDLEKECGEGYPRKSIQNFYMQVFWWFCQVCDAAELLFTRKSDILAMMDMGSADQEDAEGRSVYRIFEKELEQVHTTISQLMIRCPNAQKCTHEDLIECMPKEIAEAMLSYKVDRPKEILVAAQYLYKTEAPISFLYSLAYPVISAAAKQYKSEC